MVTMRVLSIALMAAIALMLASTAGFADAWVHIDPRTGCHLGLLTIKPHQQVTVHWSGGCKDGFADGPGIVTLKGTEKVQIEGTFSQGGLNGRALITYADGSRFEGEMERGMRRGRGRVVRPGIGHVDVQNGPMGIEYGEFVYDKACRCDTPGGRYTGDLPRGKRDGKGILTMPNGDRYEGEWRDGLPDGAGTLTQNGKSYSGRWHAGCSQSGSTTYKFLVTSCSP